MCKPDTVARAERVLGTEVMSWTRVESRGYGKNEHWTLECVDGTRAFAKVASIPPSPQWLRDEVNVYESVQGPFMPRFLGWEDGSEPLLMLEDVSIGAHAPPPWRHGDVDSVLAAVREMAGAARRGELPSLTQARWQTWDAVARDPVPLLSLGLVSPEWLHASLPALVDAAARTPLHGHSLVHCDLRSDNLVLRDGRAVLVDWNHAHVGNSRFDVAFWLPSLALEGGPEPDGFGVDEFAAFVAGFFAARAGLPPPEGAPDVRRFQLAQLEVALPWACAVLGLRPTPPVA